MSKREQMKQPKQSPNGTSFISSLLLLSGLLVSFFAVFWILRTPEDRLGRAYQAEEKSDSPRAAKHSTSATAASDSDKASASAVTSTQGDSTASATEPSNIEDGLEKARILMDSGSVTESAAVLAKLQEADPTNEKILYQRALLASREQNDPAGAKVLLEKIVEQNPAQIAAADELYFTYEMTKDFDGGMRKMQELKQKAGASEKPALDYVMGRLLLEAGQTNEGRIQLEQAVAAGANDSFVREHLAEAYERSGMYQKSKEAWESLAQDETPSYSSLNAKSKLAEILVSEGKFDEAEQKVQELLAIHPKHPEGLKLQAALQQRRSM